MAAIMIVIMVVMLAVSGHGMHMEHRDSRHEQQRSDCTKQGNRDVVNCPSADSVTASESHDGK